MQLLLSCGAHVDDSGSNSAHTIIFCPLYSALINMAKNNNKKSYWIQEIAYIREYCSDSRRRR